MRARSTSFSSCRRCCLRRGGGVGWWRGMSLQLEAATSCLSAGHTFWLIKSCRGWITQAFPVKPLFFFLSSSFSSPAYVITALAFLGASSPAPHSAPVWTVMTDDWYWQGFLVFFCCLKFLQAVNCQRSCLRTDEITMQSLPDLPVGGFLMSLTLSGWGLGVRDLHPLTLLKNKTKKKQTADEFHAI